MRLCDRTAGSRSTGLGRFRAAVRQRTGPTPPRHRSVAAPLPRALEDRGRPPDHVELQPWPWRVLLPADLPVSGAILVDQVRSIDRIARNLRIAGQAPPAVVADVQAKLAVLLGMER